MKYFGHCIAICFTVQQVSLLVSAGGAALQTNRHSSPLDEEGGANLDYDKESSDLVDYDKESSDLDYLDRGENTSVVDEDNISLERVPPFVYGNQEPEFREERHGKRDHVNLAYDEESGHPNYDEETSGEDPPALNLAIPEGGGSPEESSRKKRRGKRDHAFEFSGKNVVLPSYRGDDDLSPEESSDLVDYEEETSGEDEEDQLWKKCLGKPDLTFAFNFEIAQWQKVYGNQEPGFREKHEEKVRFIFQLICQLEDITEILNNYEVNPEDWDRIKIDLQSKKQTLKNISMHIWSMVFTVDNYDLFHLVKRLNHHYISTSRLLSYVKARFYKSIVMKKITSLRNYLR